MINRARWRWSAHTATRYGLPLGVLVLSVAFALWWRWGLVVSLPLLAVAAWDFLQREHTLRRNYPLLARFRWIMEDLRPFAQAYVVEGDLEGRPFNHDERSLVYARAKGELDSHPFGTELDVIASVVLGGTSLMGGNGSVARTIIGVMFLGIMNNGMNILNVSIDIQLIAKGAIIARALALAQRG